VALAFIDSSRALGEDFIANERDEPKEWRDAAALANADVWLTVEEAQEVAAGLAAVVEPYRKRALDTRPDGTRRVRITNMVIPHRTS
jgi:hypothetical protein